MKILMKDYQSIRRRMISPANGMPVNWDWLERMEQIAGQELEVETKYLFRDQFNTAPVPGVSEKGFRIMLSDVEAVIDDERYGVKKCEYCGNQQKKGDVCTGCGKGSYLRPLLPEGREELFSPSVAK